MKKKLKKKKFWKKFWKFFWNIFDVLSLPPTAAPSPRCLPPRGTTPGWCYLQIVLNWRKNYKSFCLWGTTKKFKILKKKFKIFEKKIVLKKILKFFLKFVWNIFDVLSLPPTAAPSPRCLPPRGTTPGWCYLQIVLNWRKNYKSFCLWGTTKKI